MGKASKAGTDFFRYSGRSMWPGFQKGDLLEVQPVDLIKLRVGDCITYRLDGSKTFVSHRVSAILGESICTRGDAFPWSDNLSISEKQIVGRVVGRYRLGCFKMVSGGVKGLLARGFYHYAGRLDPQRDARGGHAARLLRRSLQWLAAGFYRRGTIQEFSDVDKGINRYWLVGQRPWASFDYTQGSWLVLWPQSLLIDPAKIVCP